MNFLSFFSESLKPVGLAGHDADLRQQQQSTCNSGVGDVHMLFNWLSETLANARHSDSSLTDTVNKALGLNTDDAFEELKQKHKLNCVSDKKEYEPPTCTKIENVHFKGVQSPLLEVTTSSLKYPVAVPTSEVGVDHKLHSKEVSICLFVTFVCFSLVFLREHENMLYIEWFFLSQELKTHF